VIIKASSHPDETDPDLPRPSDRWMRGKTCEVCGTEVTEDHRFCHTCCNRLLADLRRETAAQRTARMMRLVEAVLFVRLPERERLRILAERVCHWEAARLALYRG